MLNLVKQVFLVLSSFSSSLARVVKVSEFKYYPFMISLGKCNWSCNVLSPTICVLKKTKDIKVQIFNMITNTNEAKTMTKHTSCDSRCIFNSTTCNSNLK